MINRVNISLIWNEVLLCPIEDGKLMRLYKLTVLLKPPEKMFVIEYYFSYFLIKTYVVGAQKNRLTETILLSTLSKCLN